MYKFKKIIERFKNKQAWKPYLNYDHNVYKGGYYDGASMVSNHAIEVIEKLEEENKLLKQVVYAAAMFLDYFPKQIHPELNAEDFLKEPPLGSTGFFEPRIDSKNVYSLAKTAKETLIYLEANNNG